MHSSIFKAIARRALRGKWQKTALIIFVGTLISGGIPLDAGEIKPVFQLNLSMLNPRTINLLLIILCICLLLALIVGAVVNVGMYRLGLKILDGEEPHMKMLFPMKLALRAVAMNVLRALAVYAVMIAVFTAAIITRSKTVLTYGMSIGFIPAFFLSYCYAMADYLLLGREKMGPIKALRESRRRMKGFKSDLFWLELSFIGWTLLSMLPPLILISLLEPISIQAALVGSFAATIVCGAFVSAYQVVAKTAFFREVDNPEDGYAKRRAAQQEAARQAYERMREQQQAEPEAEPEPAPEPAPSVDYDAARQLFLDYGCSRAAMHEAGVLEDYDAMGVDSSFESRWMREYIDLLIRRFDRDAETIDDILRFAAEYAHEEIIDRALMRIDRHARSRSLPAEEILGMAGRVLVLLKSGRYHENPAYAQRKTDQIADMVNRIAEADGESDTIAKLRELM